MNIKPTNISEEEKTRIFKESLKNQTPYVEKEPVKIRSVNRWISCKDKMPEDRTLVLFCYVNEKGLRSVHYGYHFNINGITAWAKLSGGLQYCDDEVTHWQPLPEPPKDGDAE